MAPLTRCNAYGAENVSGAVNTGGFDSQPVAVQWHCPEQAAHRFRWVCEHGHKGLIVDLCERHWEEFTGQASVPWPLRRDVRFCPRCNAESDHNCAVRLVPVS